MIFSLLHNRAARQIKYLTMTDGGKKGRGGIFAAMGAATGLGNAFRFPALCAEYGAAFIIVYLFALLIVCYPLLCAELALGKGMGNSKKYDSARRIIFGAACINSAVIAVYYGVIAVKLASASVAFALYAEPNAPQAALPVFAAVCLILFKGQSALNISGKASVCASFALFAPLAAVGLFTCRIQFDAAVLFSGGAWSDALGQALLSLSLAAGVMPSFARTLPENTSPPKAAAKIVAANFCGCLAAAFATLPHVAEFPQGGGVACAFTVFPLVIRSAVKGEVTRRIFGAFAYAALCAVAVHSLCSLAYPSIARAVKKIKIFPLLFCAVSAAAAPLFALNDCEILNACDRAACCVTAVIIAFAECLYFAKTRHIKGVIALLIKFACTPCCAVAAALSLCSARFSGFSAFALTAAVLTVAAPLLYAAFYALKTLSARMRARPYSDEFY